MVRRNDRFVSGPLEDEDFLELIQNLSMLSANCPEETVHYAAHVLVGNILHAHPSYRVRLTVFSDTLEHYPYEALLAMRWGG